MEPWYHNLTRSYVLAFSKIFSDIHIQRFDNEGIVQKNIKVPLSYATKTKMTYMVQNKELGVATILPRIGFSIESMEYDSMRKMNSLNEINSGSQFIYEGIPYNYIFNVSIKTTLQDDLYQIIEQVLTRFKPDLSLTVKEIPILNIERDVAVTLETLAFDNQFEFGEDDTRHLGADLTFILRGMLYPPTQDATIINEVDVDLIHSTTQEQLRNINHLFVDDVTTTTWS